MSNFRDLAPRPPGTAAPASEPANTTRNTKVAVACGTCRLKRTKVRTPRIRGLAPSFWYYDVSRWLTRRQVRWSEAKMPSVHHTNVQLRLASVRWSAARPTTEVDDKRARE